MLVLLDVVSKSSYYDVILLLMTANIALITFNNVLIILHAVK